MESKDKLISRLTGEQRPNNRAKAISNLSTVLGVIEELYHKHGDEFDVDLRALAKIAGLNRKTATRWITKLAEIGVLAVTYKGKWKAGATSYKLILTDWLSAQSIPHIYIATPLQGRDSLSHSHLGTYSENEYEYVSLPSNEVAEKRCGILCDLPDILPDDIPLIDPLAASIAALSALSDKERAWQTREISRQRKAQLGQQFVMQLWRQCESERRRGGRYQYPIHPDVYEILTTYDHMYVIDPKEAEGQFQESMSRFYVKGTLAPKYRFLFQPDKSTRLKCPKCRDEGRERTCRLRFLLNTRFGAIKYWCDGCKSSYDLWKEYPVYAFQYVDEKPDEFQCAYPGANAEVLSYAM